MGKEWSLACAQSQHVSVVVLLLLLPFGFVAWGAFSTGLLLLCTRHYSVYLSAKHIIHCNTLTESGAEWQPWQRGTQDCESTMVSLQVVTVILFLWSSKTSHTSCRSKASSPFQSCTHPTWASGTFFTGAYIMYYMASPLSMSAFSATLIAADSRTSGYPLLVY